MSRIPTYRVKIPEYRVETLKEFSGEMIKTYWGIPIPREYEEQKPDLDLASSKIITCLRKHFLGKRIGLRLLSSVEHIDKSRAEIIEIIKEIGHDRYDSTRVGDRYENLEKKKIDFFALELTVGKEDEEESVKYALESFYYYPIYARKNPVRIDIGIVYDLDQLQIVEHQYEGREDEIKRDGFVFKHSERKSDAVVAILEIL